MAGLAGFEPTNAGIKNRCLTTWRQPNMLFLKCGFLQKFHFLKGLRQFALSTPFGFSRPPFQSIRHFYPFRTRLKFAINELIFRSLLTKVPPLKMAHLARLLGINPSSSLHSDRLTASTSLALRERTHLSFSPAGVPPLKMAHLARFELTTFAFGGQHSIQLSYKCKCLA